MIIIIILALLILTGIAYAVGRLGWQKACYPHYLAGEGIFSFGIKLSDPAWMAGPVVQNTGWYPVTMSNHR